MGAEGDPHSYFATEGIDHPFVVEGKVEK